MRNTSIDEVCELIFDLILVVENVVGHVDDLKHLHFLAMAVVLLDIHLHVLRCFG